MPERIAPKEARNQLGKLGAAKGPTHFSREAKKVLVGSSPPLVTGLFLNHYKKSLQSFTRLQDMCGLT